MQEQLGFEIPFETVGPSSCLGESFPDIHTQQLAYRDRLAEALDPVLWQDEGFPQGTREVILDLSDPPLYTACPNPFIKDFLRYCTSLRTAERSDYDVGPYLSELDIQKRHDVYAFHPYHTKVPPEIIKTLIEHYTEPGDIVLDGFCGSGMTGVAARDADRHAILVDLSPIATFIAGANTQSHDWVAAIGHLRTALEGCQKRWGPLYETREGRRKLRVNYFVWSDLFSCPKCSHIFPFFPHGVIHHGTKVETRDAFPCPSCSAELNVRKIKRVIDNGRKEKRLVWVNAGEGQERINRAPGALDLKLARELEQTDPEAWYPTDPINPQGYSAKLAQLGDKTITDVSRLLSRRNLIIYADLWATVGEIPDAGLRHICRATLTSIFTVISERQGYFGGGGGMSGNMYMPIVRMEKNPLEVLQRKLRKLEAAERAKATASGTVLVSTQSSTDLQAIPDASVDYVYVDPPFGANIIYSELNLVLEGWLRLTTNPSPEAVIDTSRERDTAEYADLMSRCFSEFFRVLKPGRWMTVEFHNTAAEVWNIIQNGIREAGFEIEQIAILDKGTTTILSDIRPGAAKHDLVISARKVGPQQRAQSASETVDIWALVSQWLADTPMPATSPSRLERRAREDVMLFNRIVAFHVERGQDVPISAAEFYRQLLERFPRRAGMYLTPMQAKRFDETVAIDQGAILPEDAAQSDLFSEAAED